MDPIIRVISLCAGHLNFILEFEKNLQSLRTSTKELKDLTTDVTRRVEIIESNSSMMRTPQVEAWLRRAHTMEDEVERILIEGYEEIEDRRLGGFCPGNCFASYRLGEEVVQKIKEVEQMERQVRGFNVAAEALSIREMPISKTIGMDFMVEKAWNCIREEQVGIVGIYGMAGVGKTTLLMQINNKFLSGGTPNFDFLIWVTVSKEVQIMRIQEDIAKRLRLPLPKDESLDDRALKLYSMLKKKKFVLLLDDIWEYVDLIAIGIPRPNINNKSKIIFTTRSQFVCGQMEAQMKIRVECLDWPEAWKLFQVKVGAETLNSHPEIPELAKDVAKECAGLPLALITIGRAMAAMRTPQEWMYAKWTLRNSTSEFLHMEDEVFRILRFSYLSLPNDTVKSCFLYCSLFPKDHSIEIDQLISYWIGEGLLEEFGDIGVARSKGYHIIRILKEACLLESSQDSQTGGVRMHGIIRDLAILISSDSGDKFLVQAGVNLTEAPEVWKWRDATRISLMKNNIQTLGNKVPECPYLLTLIISENSHLTNISDHFFNSMHHLRVLDLSNTGIHMLPMSIAGLVELQYLGLARTLIRSLPREMGNLLRLKCLDLSHTLYLESIPYGILSKFSKLQVVDLTKSSFEHWESESYGTGQDDRNGEASIEELECLKDLKVVSISISNAACLKRVLDSHKFTGCSIELSINRCHDLTSIPLPTIGILKSPGEKRNGFLPNLRKLHISSCTSLKDLAWIRGAPNLELLYVNDCMDLQVICYGITDGCFPNLHQVDIRDCNELKDLSWLLGAPNLESLDVRNCNGLELICDGEDAEVKENLMKFSRLISLTLINLPELKSIHGLFPSDILISKVENCPKLPLE